MNIKEFPIEQGVMIDVKWPPLDFPELTPLLAPGDVEHKLLSIDLALVELRRSLRQAENDYDKAIRPMTRAVQKLEELEDYLRKML